MLTRFPISGAESAPSECSRERGRWDRLRIGLIFAMSVIGTGPHLVAAWFKRPSDADTRIRRPRQLNTKRPGHAGRRTKSWEEAWQSNTPTSDSQEALKPHTVQVVHAVRRQEDRTHSTPPIGCACVRSVRRLISFMGAPGAAALARPRGDESFHGQLPEVFAVSGRQVVDVLNNHTDHLF